MKITIVQGAFFPVPPLMGGAVEKIWYVLAKEFVLDGHQVTYISKKYQGQSKLELVDGINHIRVKGYDTPTSIIILKLLDLFYSIRALKKIPKDTDIIVSNTFWLPILLPSKLKKLCMVDVQRTPKWQFDLYSKEMRFRACSKMIFEQLESSIHPNYHDKIFYIPNPVPFGSKNFSNNKKNTILFVGRLDKEKGVHVLIDAFNLLNKDILESWTLNIVGSYDINEGGSGRNYYEELLGKKGNVNFFGSIYDEYLLSEFYSDSKIFCYPVQDDSGDAGPIAPREAMFYGCATILSNHECFDEYAIEENNCLRFNQSSSNQISDLSSQLLRLINDDALCNRISVNGRKTANDFSISSVAKMFLNNFKSVGSE